MLPIPPLKYRQLVGPKEESFYDNPTGDFLWGNLNIGPLKPGEAYRRVFDFECGCGRIARQLQLQHSPPEKYVGIDINHEMVKWCQSNLRATCAEFHFHDAWNPTYAPNNTNCLTRPIRHFGNDFTLINARSVFTHLYQSQTEFYLREFCAMLSTNGIVRTIWFLFNRSWFPTLADSQHCVYINEVDPTQAVYYDWSYLLDLFKHLDLRIVEASWTEIPGFQSDI